ncbi:MAG: protein-S-isoprenylcysteine O-methyltransferase Ste14 [Planctomycetota bacterium]|jgi:protein-S-isoprenylcysteine O-methyltransferase Ste14
MSASYPRDIPPLWLLLTTAAMVTLHFTLPLQMLVMDPWRNLGWIVIAAGVLLVVLSAFRFKRAGTGVRPFSEATTVVSGGAFRWTRNPMYLGMVTVTVGVAICLGSASPLWLPVMLFFVLDRRFVRREEEFLRLSMGTAYDEYCARVRRWI